MTESLYAWNLDERVAIGTTRLWVNIPLIPQNAFPMKQSPTSDPNLETDRNLPRSDTKADRTSISTILSHANRNRHSHAPI
eukprot:jgi/Psemu1/306131/fgenesh1_kg.236_\